MVTSPMMAEKYQSQETDRWYQTVKQTTGYLIFKSTHTQRQLGMETEPKLPVQRTVPGVAQKGSGRGGQAGEKVFSLPAGEEMYPIQKGDGQGEFEVMGSLAGVLPSLSWGTRPGARIEWEEDRRKGRKGSPPKEFGVFEKEGNQKRFRLPLQSR